MPELSTLLRQRLRATGDRSLQHPDPDALNAYIEDVLPAHERERVLEHISRCTPCREVVTLSMPETVLPTEATASAAAAVAATPRRRWFLSPAFGLAGSTAAMILGVVLILRLSAPHSSVHQVQEAQATPAGAANPIVSSHSAEIPQTAPPASVQPSTAPADVAGNTATAPQMTAVNRAPSSEPALQRERTATASRIPVVADLRGQDFVNKTFLAKTYDTQAASPVYRDLPQAPVPTQSNLGFAPPAVVAGNPFQSNGSFVIPSNPAGSNHGVLTFYSTHTGSSNTLIGKIVDFGKRPLTKHLGPPIPSSSLGESSMFKPGATTVQPSDAISAAKSESGTGSGELAGSPAFTRRALSSDARAQIAGVSQYQWKVVQGKLLRSSDLSHWTEENPGGENLQFSVVSPNGLEIWAGGNDAALMHSHDGGSNWERITLGAAATGTINSIEAAGQNVLVKSSSGQSWLSQDGGKSWIVQD
ncbi:MAG TPA: YCF48-related protein [Candidatus Angelobacter sp.]|nr:YCF48-related protein [Candidatus Angelobacter sp.]